MRSTLIFLVGLLAIISVVNGASTTLNKLRQETTETAIKPQTFSITLPFSNLPLFCPGSGKVGEFTHGSFTATIVKTKGNYTDCLMVSSSDCVELDKLTFKVHGDGALNNGDPVEVRAKLKLSNRARVDTTSPPSLDKDVFKFLAELDIYDEKTNVDYDGALGFTCKFVPGSPPDCDLTELDFLNCP